MSNKAQIKERKEKQKAQQQTRQNIMVAGLALAIVVVIGVMSMRANSVPGADLDLDAIPDNSVVYENMGQDHIAVGDPHVVYNSNPPTSGPHANSVPTRFYTTQQVDENMIHNLEHGHIWISYRDQNDTEVKDLLQEIQSGYPSSVVVTYRPANDARIAVAAWTRLLELEEADEDQILAFIRRYIDNAPESVSG